MASTRNGRPNVHNVATAHDTPAARPEVTDDDPHDVSVLPFQGRELDILLEKSGPSTTWIGDAITYTFNVTNTGNMTLTNVHITDRSWGRARFGDAQHLGASRNGYRDRRVHRAGNPRRK